MLLGHPISGQSDFDIDRKRLERLIYCVCKGFQPQTQQDERCTLVTTSELLHGCSAIIVRSLDRGLVTVGGDWDERVGEWYSVEAISQLERVI